ncbi:hypothetical protein [Saccharibacter floricola]|uniref:Uncharacterized protein n=1 Tax=Saccharibacter floricola DSM 15669 TaxID=1123227 RepID=A0ABQ0P059_9PROT|nr:hypothetical protein [Saccharibacter floricola]GBQ07491.1 hypothetical protein AA15669_1400 [Saccharibacter floricola DSM 15669]
MNPYSTTQASGLFSSDTTGAMQGLSLADPATRYRLSQGYVSPNETLPMWGGLAVSEHISGIAGSGPTNAASMSSRMGSELKRATSATDMIGVTLYDHGNHMIVMPGSNAAQAAPGNSIGFARFGSNMRVPVPADPALRQQIGQNTNLPLGWDFQNQRLIAGTSGNTIPVRLLEIYETGGQFVRYDATKQTLNWTYADDNAKDTILVLIQL